MHMVDDTVLLLEGRQGNFVIFYKGCWNALLTGRASKVSLGLFTKRPLSYYVPQPIRKDIRSRSEYVKLC